MSVVILVNVEYTYFSKLTNKYFSFLQSERIQKVVDCVNEVHSLCGVLGLDFGKTVSDVHPSLHETSLGQSTNISVSALESLEQAIFRLKTERKVRYQKVLLTSVFS